MTYDFRTEQRKKIDERNAAITARFKELRNAANKATYRVSNARIYEFVANEFEMSKISVRNICIKSGVSKPVRV